MDKELECPLCGADLFLHEPDFPCQGSEKHSSAEIIRHLIVWKSYFAHSLSVTVESNEQLFTKIGDLERLLNNQQNTDQPKNVLDRPTKSE